MSPSHKAILALLHKRKLVTVAAIKTVLYGHKPYADYPCSPNTVYVFVSQLRKMLPPGVVQNVYGEGWKLNQRMMEVWREQGR